MSSALMSSAFGDFDFFMGDWQVRHRRLKERLAGCDEWEMFGGTCSTRKILGGHGNMDDNVLELPGGTYRAATLRTCDAKTGRWSIWWLDARDPTRLDVPMVGRFEGGVGTFHAEHVFAGKPVRVRFLWTRTDGATPRWEQAFSPDGGKSWEINWTMDFAHVP